MSWIVRFFHRCDHMQEPWILNHSKAVTCCDLHWCMHSWAACPDCVFGKLRRTFSHSWQAMTTIILVRVWPSQQVVLRQQNHYVGVCEFKMQKQKRQTTWHSSAKQSNLCQHRIWVSNRQSSTAWPMASCPCPCAAAWCFLKPTARVRVLRPGGTTSDIRWVESLLDGSWCILILILRVSHLFSPVGSWSEIQQSSSFSVAGAWPNSRHDATNPGDFF